MLAKYRLFRAWSENNLEIYFKFLRRHQSPFEEATHFSTLLDKLYGIEGIEPAKAEWRELFVRVEYATLNPGSLHSFIEFYNWVIEQLRMT